MTEPERLLAAHARHAWQPFTQMKLAGEPVVIARGAGTTLETIGGETVLDAIGSWWVNIHGHNNPAINAAIEEQLHKIEHVIYAGLTHEKAIELSSALSETTGDRLPRVFFSDNGSTAVEIAMKMAFQYFVNAGTGKKREFATLDGGYHGDTFGAMAAGARSVFHEAFEPLLFRVHHAPFPEIPFARQNDEAECDRLLRPAIDALEHLFAQHGENLCGFLLEPLLQGAGGMRIYPASYLRRVRELCDRYEVFLIADEVFTGIGRTGTMYACEQSGIWPDLIALSKGLSGGYLPFAATLATEKIYEGFNSENRLHTLFHGHSMTGSALGCAAALASLTLMRDENRLADVKRIAGDHKRRLGDLASGGLAAKIRETRWIGSVGVVEFNLDERYTGNFGWEFHRRALEKGVLLRPLGPVVYLAPPYTTSDDELDRIYRVIDEIAISLLA